MIDSRHLDCSYFERLGAKASVNKLAEHEQAGTLKEFIQEVAPDYIHSGEVKTWALAQAMESLLNGRK